MARVLVATLADGVEATPGRKFNVLGGGVDAFHASSLPMTLARLSLLVAIEVDAGETGPVKATSVFKGTDGKEFMRLDMDFGARDPGAPRAIIWAGANLPPITSKTAGRMSIEVSCGDSRFDLGLDIHGPVTPIFPTPTGTAQN